MNIKRDKELAPLHKAYHDMYTSRELQLRFICGEAGTGKTVLANMFINEMQGKDPDVLFVSSYCSIRSEYNIPYQPFKELLKNLLNDVKEDEESKAHPDKNARVKDTLKFCGSMLLEHAPDLIGNFIPGASLIASIGQSLLKKEVVEKPPVTVEETKILEQYVDAIKAISSRYKLVFFIDDLQWIDKLSVNLFYQLIMGLANYPVMIIGCYRSTDIDISIDGEKHPLSKLLTEVKISWGNVFINLDQLSTQDKKEFMNRLLDTDKNMYDLNFREKLYKRTNGNPLFITELMNLLKEEGMLVRNNDDIWMNNAELHWNAYPVRIEGIIQERIGRLEDSLVEILTHASVQGHSFIAQVLSKTMGESERDLLIKLSKTLQKQHHLVYEGDCMRLKKGIVTSFNFSNYIFQQYLYQELSMTQRMLLHSDIASIMEELFKENLDTVSGDIARHYEMAGEYEKALLYIQHTVNSMIRVSGYEEASVLCRKALSFIDEMTRTTEIKEFELHFTLQLCICYRSNKGWGNPEVEKVYYKAKELMQEMQEYDYIDIVNFGLWTIHLTRMELDKCLEMANKYLEDAIRFNNIQSEKSAYISIANTYFWLGNLKETGTYLTLFQELADKNPVEEDLLNRIFHDMFYLLTGYAQEDDAYITYKNKLDKFVNTSSDRFAQAVAYQALSWFAYMARDINALDTYTQQMLDISEKYKFPPYIGVGKVFRAACYTGSDTNEAIDLVKEGYKLLCNHCEAEPVIMYSIYGLVLGECYLKQGNENFIPLIDSVIETVSKQNEKCYLGELLVLKAGFYQYKDPAEATRLLQQALNVAGINNNTRLSKDIHTMLNQ